MQPLRETVNQLQVNSLYDPAILFLGIFHPGENIYPQKDLYVTIHNSIIDERQRLEAI